MPLLPRTPPLQRRETKTTVVLINSPSDRRASAALLEAHPSRWKTTESSATPMMAVSMTWRTECPFPLLPPPPTRFQAPGDAKVHGDVEGGETVETKRPRFCCDPPLNNSYRAFGTAGLRMSTTGIHTPAPCRKQVFGRESDDKTTWYGTCSMHETPACQLCSCWTQQALKNRASCCCDATPTSLSSNSSSRL